MGLYNYITLKETPKKSLDIDQSNKLEIGLDFIFATIFVCYLLWTVIDRIWLEKTRSDTRTKNLIKEEIKIHNLEKKPKQIKMESKISNIEKNIDDIKDKVDSRGDKTDKIMEKLSDAIGKLTETLGEMNIRLARVETKLENK